MIIIYRNYLIGNCKSKRYKDWITVVFIIIRGLDTLSVGGGNKKLKIEKYSVYRNF